MAKSDDTLGSRLRSLGKIALMSVVRELVKQLPARLRLKVLLKVLTRNKEMIEKLKSRKLWVTVASAVVTIIGQQLGLSEVATIIVGVLGSSYVVGQGLVDASTVKAAATVAAAKK